MQQGSDGTLSDEEVVMMDAKKRHRWAGDRLGSLGFGRNPQRLRKMDVKTNRRIGIPGLTVAKLESFGSEVLNMSATPQEKARRLKSSCQEFCMIVVNSSSAIVHAA